MRRSIPLASFPIVAFVVFATVAAAQPFEKKNYNYSEWTKGRFSEAVTVTGPGKMIFLAGVGAEDENGKAGDILHKGDFTAQCKYAYDKIKRALAKNGAALGDIVKMVTYLTDVRYQADYGQVPPGDVRTNADAGAHAARDQSARLAGHDGRDRRDGDGSAGPVRGATAWRLEAAGLRLLAAALRAS